MKPISYLFTLMLILAYLSSCESNNSDTGSTEKTEQPTEASTAEVDNALTAAEKEQGWKLLFDGKTTKGWRNFKQDSVVGWLVEDGALMTLGEGGGDIMTVDQYEDFELIVDWKIPSKANSGIIYLVVEGDAYDNTYETGPEYQLIDDEGYDVELKPAQKSGANYDMHPPQADAFEGTGTYNRARIVKKGPHVEHWLNGQKVLEYELWTSDWDQHVQDSKWQDFPDYGKAKKGHIALQDHGAKIWFKNIKIKPI